MSDFFSPPPEGAVPESAAKMEFLTLQYRPMKTPSNFVDTVTKEVIAKNRREGKFGFSYYDKEAKANVALENLNFVALGVVSAVTGVEKTVGGTYVNWYGSRVRDTRTDEMAVWNGSREPAFKGLYGAIKPNLPKGVSAQPMIAAYCIDLDRLIEVPASSFCGRQIQRAIAAADSAVSGKTKKWETVSVFGIGSDDYLWGFSHSAASFERQTIEGEPYIGVSDMYFAPVFKCGIVQPTKSPELHAKCVALQNEFRAYMDARKAFAGRTASEPAHEPEPAPEPAPQSVATNIRPNHAATNAGFETPTRQEPAPNAFDIPVPVDGIVEDLPF